MVWGIAGLVWFFALQILLAGAGAPWFWLTTRYRLFDDYLLLKSGPFFKRIAYADIMAVKNGRKQKGLSFAFSRDCLQIDVAGSKLGFRVSPREQERFLQALASCCEHMVFNGRELVFKDETIR